MAELKYSQAMEKLNAIMERMEGEEIDVDELSKQVKEAVKLIKLCKEKIERAEMEVKSVVDAFQKDLE
ncbi:MAG TPA: exodeoxyribonuclease VII small subunit [Candidatus Bathyarchaeia archaeon]|nr:exodeoxyribonuclease VII small subunit [Candidatus Bathyarchaeia archaeon]